MYRIGEEYLIKQVPSDEVRIRYNNAMCAMMAENPKLTIRIKELDRTDNTAMDEHGYWWCLENLIPVTPSIKLKLN